MPGNPFRPAFKGGKTRASVRSPAKPGVRTTAPPPVVPNGVKSARAAGVRAPRTRITTGAARISKLPSVKQGTPIGTPGRNGGSGSPW